MIVRESGSSSWINVAVIGPHQQGKSTLAGFLLYALNQIPRVRMNEAEKAAVKRNDPGRKFAFLLDRKVHERKIIANVCRGTQEPSWWTLERRGQRYTLINSPGCYDCTKSLTGVLSDADAVLFVVDTGAFLESLQQKQTMLGSRLPATLAQIYTGLSLARFYDVQQLIIALHKMDTIDFSKEKCLEAKIHLERILEELGWRPDQVRFVPTAVTATEEKTYNILEPSPVFNEWFSHASLLRAIEQLYPRSLPARTHFRMQLNSVNQGKRGLIAEYQLTVRGKIVAGAVQVGNELLIQPSGTRCKVKNIQNIDNSRYFAPANLRQQRMTAIAGEPVNLLCTILDGDIKVSRGEIAGTDTSSPPVSQRLRAELTPLTTLPLSDLFAKKLTGTFVLGHFHSSFNIDDFSFDGGLTWLCRGNKSARQKRAIFLDNITASHADIPILGELRLARHAPLETYANNNCLGRFVLFGSDSFPIFGGRIIEIL